jgi:hypothetical protein
MTGKGPVKLKNAVHLPFPVPAMQCYIVTMANPFSPHPLSPAAGTGSRLVLAGLVLGVVWLAVVWALS